MLYRVSFLYAIYPPDFQQFTTPEDLQNFTNDQPIGSGLFKVNQWDKDKGLVILDANDDYFLGRPKIDQVIFQKFDNSDALIQALRVGDIDLITSVPASAYETVTGFENVTVVQQPSRSFEELIINSASEALETNTGNPALRDPAVREALAYAMNKQDIVDIVVQGLGDPAWSIVAPSLGGGFWHNPNISDREFNPDRANQLLDDAGYVMGADGVREKDGVQLDFRLQYDADFAEYARIADLLTESYRAIGVKTTPEAVDSDTLIAATTGVADFDLVIWGWGGDPDPDFILSIMLCDQFEVGGWSDSGYCDAGYDQLYLDQQQATDPAARQQIIYDMQEMLFRDLPYIVLYNYDQLQAVRSDRFTGFPDTIANPSLTSDFASALVLINVEPVR
jgi:peptide/nickel transport system substrate-binding protein